jgi:S-formylglutathione hydrolase FrmB
MTKFLRRLALLLVFSSAAWAAGRVECGVLPPRTLPLSAGYCALLPPGYDAQRSAKFPVLYFLHGLGGNHEFLATSGGWQLIEDLRERGKIGEFVIITPQAWSSFYINSKSGRVKYEDFFMREFMPAMQRKFRIRSDRAGVAIGGASMGGYGALRLAFKYPKRFTAVAVHEPALMENIPAALLSSGFGRLLASAFGSPFDSAFWRANTPFVFARTADLSGLKIYMDVGDQDDFAFDVGTEAMDKLLTARKAPHESHIYPGHHGEDFMMEHLPESLAFISKSFGK